MTTLYLIRHAEAEGNVFRRLQGHYNAMITPNGRKQIAALARRFAEVPIDAVYASDLSRTCCTAGAIYLPKNLPLHKDPRFRELYCGCWENLPFGWLDHVDPERNHAFTRRPRDWQVEGSERFTDYTARFLEAMGEAARAHDGQTVAIFSHGMVMRGVLQTLFFPDRDNLGHSENTAVTKLLYEDGKYTLEYLNDDSHIPYEISTLGRQEWWRGGDHRDFNMWYRDPAPEDEDLLRELNVAGDIVRISMIVDRPTGAVALKLLPDERAQLSGLVLLQAHRGKGLSAQLLGEAVSVARTAGKRLLTVERLPDDPAAKRLLADYGMSERGMPLLPAADLIEYDQRTE
ncbi:MAG: GNAT family N-acetyltransferase [Oscillospiraceae bacterium]|nr:GNAT family N-acetyltransferase [Oscillospiraceae bacterium]